MNTQLTATETKYLRVLAKKYILLPTKFKKPLEKGWNKYYPEYRSIERLLEINQEYSLRTGTPIGNYYFVVIDLDDCWAKERIKDVRYVTTHKGVHRYLLIRELPKSCFLVDNNGQRIGELHSKGRFVVGIGSIHQAGTRYTLKGRSNVKFCLKFDKLTELQEFLKERNIFTTSWGKTGKENIRDLQPYVYKVKKQVKLAKEVVKPKADQRLSDLNKSDEKSQGVRFYRKKEKLAAKVNSKPNKNLLNICYICLVYFPKEGDMIKVHLTGKKHQKKWKEYLVRTNSSPLNFNKINS